MTPRLLARFDVARLEADLAVADEFAYVDLRHPGWSALPLLSRGGRLDDAGQGIGGREPYAPTELLRRCPYFAHVIAELGIRGPCRVSALAPGGRILPHHDVAMPVRVHVPIVTSARATLTIDRRPYAWPAGEAWEADFSRTHSARNAGEVRRVHLLLVR